MRQAFPVVGNKGDTAVQIGPGYAIDCLGREIILTTPVSKSVPAIASAADGSPVVYSLVASYLDDSDQSILQKRSGVCLPSGTVRLTESPELDWKTQADLDTTTQVVLAQISVLNCQLNIAVNLGVRRFARISSQPYMFAGETSVASGFQQPWQLWLPLGSVTPVGVTSDVDTSAANFHTTPAYLAHVTGTRTWTLSTGGPGLLIPVVSVVNASKTGFTVQVQLTEQPSPDSTQWVNLVNNILQWQVMWMGVET